MCLGLYDRSNTKNKPVVRFLQPCGNKFTIKLHDNVMVQPKLDGIRCIFTKDGAYSRAGNKFMNLAHLELKLQPFFKKNPNIIINTISYDTV